MRRRGRKIETAAGACAYRSRLPAPGARVALIREKTDNKPGYLFYLSPLQSEREHNETELGTARVCDAYVFDLKESEMSKSHPRGNREIKKPKQAKKTVTPSSSGFMQLLKGDPTPTKHSGITKAFPRSS